MRVVCRDALAVLRRQYGLENSPRKRRQEISHHNEQDGLALEQVTDWYLCLVAGYIIARIKCHQSHAAADDCGRSVIHASSVSAANNICLLCIGAASAHRGSDGLLGFANVKPITAQKSSILPVVLGIQAWTGPRYALRKLSHKQEAI